MVDIRLQIVLNSRTFARYLLGWLHIISAPHAFCRDWRTGFSGPADQSSDLPQFCHFLAGDPAGPVRACVEDKWLPKFLRPNILSVYPFGWRQGETRSPKPFFINSRRHGFWDLLLPVSPKYTKGI